MLPHPSQPVSPQKDLQHRWIQQLRNTHRSTASWSCSRCPSRPAFDSSEALAEHTLSIHNSVPAEDEEQRKGFRASFEQEAKQRCVDLLEFTSCERAWRQSLNSIETPLEEKLIIPPSTGIRDSTRSCENPPHLKQQLYRSSGKGSGLSIQ